MHNFLCSRTRYTDFTRGKHGWWWVVGLVDIKDNCLHCSVVFLSLSLFDLDQTRPATPLVKQI